MRIVLQQIIKTMEQKKWLSYWKKSLLDSLKADIDIEKLKNFEIKNFEVTSQIIELTEQVNKLIDFQEERINKKKVSLIGIAKIGRDWKIFKF